MLPNFLVRLNNQVLGSEVLLHGVIDGISMAVSEVVLKIIEADELLELSQCHAGEAFGHAVNTSDGVFPVDDCDFEHVENCLSTK